MVTDRHTHAAYHFPDQLSGESTSMTLNDHEYLKDEVLVIAFAVLSFNLHFKNELQQNGCRVEMDQNKFSAPNVDLSSINFSLLDFRIFPYQDIKYGYPINICDFCQYLLIEHENGCR